MKLHATPLLCKCLFWLGLLSYYILLYFYTICSTKSSVSPLQWQCAVVMISSLVFTCLTIFSFTVEDPSFDFLRLRDYVDALACINLSAFSQENLRNGFSGEMVKEAREKLKINKVRSFVIEKEK